MNKEKCALIIGLFILFTAVVLEEYIPGWDNTVITDSLAMAQGIGIGVLGFLLGRIWS